MVRNPGDLYGVLGLTPEATQAQVRRAYRALVRENHPDTRPAGDASGQAASNARLERARAAYLVLGDPDRRADYDERTAPLPEAGAGTPRSVPHVVRDGFRQPPITVGPVRWHRTR